MSVPCPELQNENDQLKEGGAGQEAELQKRLLEEQLLTSDLRRKLQAVQTDNGARSRREGQRGRSPVIGRLSVGDAEVRRGSHLSWASGHETGKKLFDIILLSLDNYRYVHSSELLMYLVLQKR